MSDLDRSWEYINCLQIHECMNCERGHAVSFLGTHKSDFRYRVQGLHVRLSKMHLQPFTDENTVLSLKVVGNEKVGGSRRWHMIDIGLGPW
jgi:hypothetical protein